MGKRVSCLFVAFLLSSLIFPLSILAGSFPNFDNAGGGNWSDGYYRTISITNTSEVITDCQIAITPFTDKSFLDNTGLIGSWHFSCTGTNTADMSGNGNNGTINGATWVDGLFGKALQFNGKNNYVSIPTINLGSTFTIEFWMQPANLHDYGDSLSAGTTDSWLTFVTYADGHMLYCIGNGMNGFNHTWGERIATPAGEFTNGTWYHVVGTYDGNQIELFVNGVSKGTAVDKGYSINQVINIGARTALGYYFDGLIDEVKIFNRVLSAEEIKARYDYYANKIKADYSDVRFTASGGKTELPYWQESDGKFWVKVTSLPIGISELYMYYGNVSATSTSNGNNTFTFFDDFNSGFDKDKWETNNDASKGGCGAFVRDGIMHVYGGDGNAPGWLHSKADLPNKITVESRWKVHRNNDSALGGLWISNADYSIGVTGVVYNYYTYNDTAPRGAYAFKNQDSFYLDPMSEKTAKLKPYWHDVWFSQSLSYDGTSFADNVRYARNKINEPMESITHTASVTTTNLRLVITPWAWYSAPNHLFYCDWIAVRKHLFPEPVSVVSTTEYRPKNYILLENPVDLLKGTAIKPGENTPRMKFNLKYMSMANANEKSAHWKRLRIDKCILPDAAAIPDDKMQLSVWAETNNNNQWDEKDALISKGDFKDSTAWLDMNCYEITAESKTLYIVCRIPEGVTDKRTCGIEIKDTASLEFEGDDIWVRIDKTSSLEEMEIKDIEPPANRDKALETALQNELSSEGYKAWSPYYDLISKAVEEDRNNLLWKVVLSYHSPIVRSMPGPVKGNLILPKANDLIRIIKLPYPLKQEIENLIKLLGADDWETREKATQDLIAIGRPAVGLVKEALNSTDPEVKMRARLILGSIK
jgi:hypothetical protein